MRFCGIICEFNPLTNGHKYLIDQAKQLTSLPILALMSGDFTQRGEPAILDKYKRAELCVKMGCDFCLELPTAFAISPAQNFAEGAIKALTELKNVSHIVFGSECGDLNTLEKIATFLSCPTQSFTKLLKEQIKLGNNYNNALQTALSCELKNIDIKTIFSGPNNILAIEYLKAIKKLKSPLIALTIKRIDNGYNSIIKCNQFLGATAIRQLCKVNQLEKVKDFVPDITFNFLKNNIKFNFEAFNLFLRFNLRNSTPNYLATLFDYNEGVEYALIKSANNQNDISNIIKEVSGKRYRMSRIARLILYASLKFSKSMQSKIFSQDCVLKLLCTKNENKANIKYLSQGIAKIIVNIDDYKKYANESINFDLYASNVYNNFQNINHNNDLTTGTKFI